MSNMMKQQGKSGVKPVVAASSAAGMGFFKDGGMPQVKPVASVAAGAKSSGMPLIKSLASVGMGTKSSSFPPVKAVAAVGMGRKSFDRLPLREVPVA